MFESLTECVDEFSRPVCSLFGHTASQARVLVQLPKPNSSIFAIMALARLAASGRPCGRRDVTSGWYKIDNNFIENSVKPLAVGRKGYYFCGNHYTVEDALEDH